MKIYDKNTKQKFSLFFLSTFFIFLSISFFHSHHFNVVTSTANEIIDQPDLQTPDILLDSSFNCILSTFNKTINFELTTSFGEISLIEDLLFSYSFTNYHTLIYYTSNLLRAPPSEVV